MKLHINRKLIPGSQSVVIEGDSKGILFLHDLSSTPKEYQYFSEAFEKQGYSISIPLIKGHGTSMQDLQNCIWQDWYHSSKKALFELRKKCEHIVVLGQTFGAVLGLHLAAHYMIDGIILMSPGKFVLPKKRAGISGLIKKVSILSNTENKDKIICYSHIPRKALRQFESMYKHVMDDLADIHTPLLLFKSSQDAIVDQQTIEHIYTSVSSKSKKQLTVDESHHLLSVDSDREIILREAQRFTEKVFEKMPNSKGA